MKKQQFTVGEYAAGRFLVPANFADKIRVLVIGCGGSGSEMIDALVRFHHSARGIGHAGLELTVQDGDSVSATNVGRARFLPSDVGLNKAELLARRYGQLFGMPIRAISHACTKRGIRQLSEFFDLAITCVDKASFRVQVADYWCNRPTQTTWLDLGNGSYTGQVVLGSLGLSSTPRLPNSVQLFPSVRTASDDDAPSCSMEEALKSQSLFVNRFAVDVAVSMLWRLLAEGYIENHGALFDMRGITVKPIPVNHATWQFFGFQASPQETRLAA